ncbi:cysteine dioxygenase type I domain-containing protein [Apiospora kogelbergensis]|uniref:cysteine dioxygenase type I domain-containing protein n=1 Tax=Apiospora kogelbergensis TaxID=1337665 RepID=UPI00312DB9F0
MTCTVLKPLQQQETSDETKTDRFDKLVETLKDILGPSSGITSDDVDVGDLMDAMEQYTSDDREWCPYAMADDSRGYTRNLVDEGNGKSNLLILVWSPGKGSPIHDHGNAHCVMKILRGTLTETRYDFPDGDRNKPMEIKSISHHKENAVAYMADELGVHRVSNEGSDFACTRPPNVAKSGCHIFDLRSGKKSYVPKCGYYSRYGHLVKE